MSVSLHKIAVLAAVAVLAFSASTQVMGQNMQSYHQPGQEETPATPLSTEQPFLPEIPVETTESPVATDPPPPSKQDPPADGELPTLLQETALPEPTMSVPDLMASPVINVWYEQALRYGQIGNPQTQINILGNVYDTDGNLDRLQYSLNGGSTVTLPIGPDGLRLARPGDFNIAIYTTALRDGTNTVLITATDKGGAVTTKTVNFNYTKSLTWPQRYTTNWAGAAAINDQAQVVDGLWRLVSGGVRPTEVGYDRVIAIGDMNWSHNYEIMVPITTHSFTPNPSNPDDSGGVGVIIRWQGHQGTGVLPADWTRIGAYAYYSNRRDGLALRLDSASPIVRPFDFNLNRTYIFKLRVETVPQGGRYSFKVWEQGKPEPDWNSSAFSGLVNVVDSNNDLMLGSMLLVAHRADATFGNVSICPLNVTYPLTVNKTGNGTVTSTPSKSNYQCNEFVTLTAVPEPGWTFAGWTGDVSSSNPTVFFHMSKAMSVTAMFRSGQPVDLTNRMFLPVVSRDR